MTTNEQQVSDAEIHALADEQLQESRRTDVEAYLAEHPEAAARVTEYRRLNQALHRLYDPVMEEPVPPELLRRKGRQWAGPGLRAASAAGLLLLGGAVGWHLNEDLAHPQRTVMMADLVKPALFAHAVYTPEVHHPVEVGAEEQAHLVKWLSKRLRTSVRAPDLSAQGFELVGGRLLPSSGKMAAQFMYEEEGGNRITLYVRKGAWENRETAFRYAHEKGVGVFFWVDGPLGYALTGDLDKNKMLQLAKVVYLDFNP